MFLITTANEHAWKTEGNILFLGEWCKLFERREKWSKLNYEVLPYHWDDPHRLYKDHLCLNDLYEEVLLDISKNLNDIHGVSHSVRYWRIIVGLWLFGFIHVFYDRYQSIRSAVEYGKVKNTIITGSDRLQYMPEDFGTFSKWASESDEYNHYLFSRIIECINKIPFEYLDCTERSTSPIGGITNAKKEPLSFKQILKKSLQYTPQAFNKIVLLESSLDATDAMRLQCSLNQLPYWPDTEVQTPKLKIDLELRNRIHLQSSGSEFQYLLMRMIREQIPTLYVEGYTEMCRISLKAFPRSPKVILTAGAWNANEAFKFWAAYHADRNVKLLINQHGGTYGSGLPSAPEDHQAMISDTFYTWGWKSEKHKNTKPLVAAKLSAKKRGIRPKKVGRLLLIEMGYPRYAFLPEMLCISASGFLAYLNEQYQFVNALSDRNKKQLLVRLFMHDFHWHQKDRWMDKFPEIECSNPNGSLTDGLKESSLAIGTYNATTYLETFVANFPTILFWNPEHWKVRASAQPYFDRLREVGILHDTPEQAADKVNEISYDPISWWEQSDVQEAKDQFCFQFARTSDSWLEEWTRELKDQLKNRR